MKTFLKSMAAGAAVFVATVGQAFAISTPTPLPEPSSLALVGLAVAGLVAVTRKRK